MHTFSRSAELRGAQAGTERLLPVVAGFRYEAGVVGACDESVIEGWNRRGAELGTGARECALGDVAHQLRLLFEVAEEFARYTGTAASQKSWRSMLVYLLTSPLRRRGPIAPVSRGAMGPRLRKGDVGRVLLV